MARTGQAGRRDGPTRAVPSCSGSRAGANLRGPGLPYVTTLTSHKEPSPGRLEEPLPRENPCRPRVATVPPNAICVDAYCEFFGGSRVLIGEKSSGNRRAGPAPNSKTFDVSTPHAKRLGRQTYACLPTAPTGIAFLAPQVAMSL